MEKDEEMMLYFECEIKNIYESLKIMALEIDKYKKSKGKGKVK